MRKHHTGWVALFGAAAIATSGLVGVPAASADERDGGALSWPLVRQGTSSYSLDGFEIGYLPPGLERYGLHASSTTDRQGVRQSQISWVQGPDQLYGRVSVIRSERVQELDDLRESRYTHLADKGLERLTAGAGLEREAYLSESTGDVFWLERPGVAVTAHLQPERWDRGELLEMAGSVTEESGSPEAPAAEAPEAPAEEAAQEAPAEETPAEGAPAEEAPQEAPAEEAPAEEAPQEAPAEEAPAEEAPAEEAPAEQVPAEEAAQQVEPAAGEPAGKEPATGPEGAGEAGTPAEEVPADGAVEAAPVGNPGAPQESGAAETPGEGAQESAQEPAGSPAQTPDETPAQTPADTPVATELPEGAEARRVEECVLDRFVDFGSGATEPVGARLPLAEGEFVEQALTKEQLTAEDRDRLLATVWNHGEESAKTGAVDHCAGELRLEPAQVEGVIGAVVERVGGLVQGPAQESAPAVEQAADGSGAQEGAAADTGAAPVDPVDAREWEEMWASLPWKFEAGNA
ncbi:hypothetical protein ACIRPH_04640 [Nocardiopsis sp. NPDC101807]|uniref:hypothetical protein n=1 Tax=Nocardiopsis sp. NPDC101807 TaxID=3364339 RepID=UPI00382C70FC